MGFSWKKALGFVAPIAAIVVPGVGSLIGTAILEAVGVVGASTAVASAVGSATIAAGVTAAQGGSVEDVITAAASAGAASGLNVAAGRGVIGAVAGSVVGTAIKGGDESQILTNALAAGVGAGVQGALPENPDVGKIVGEAAKTYIATGGNIDQTLLSTAVSAVGTLDKSTTTAPIVEATGTPTTSSDINTQMQRLNLQQDLRDQLMQDQAFQQVSILPVVVAGAEIAAEVAIPAIIRAAPVIAEYMGANMAREQIAAAIADVAGHAAALWYLDNLSNEAYFGKRFIPETGQTVTVNLPPISDSEQSSLDKLYDQYKITYATIPATEPNQLNTVVIIKTNITPEQQAALSNPTTAQAAAANVSSTVTTVKPNGQTTTQPATTTSGVISVNNVVPVKTDAGSGAAGSGGSAGGGGAAGGGGGVGTPGGGAPGAGAAGGETAGAAGGGATGGGAGGDGGAAGGGTVTGAGGGGAGPGAGGGSAGAGPGAGGDTTGAGAGGDVDPYAAYRVAPDTSGGGKLPEGWVSPTPMAVPILPGPPSANVTTDDAYIRQTLPEYNIVLDGVAPTPMAVPDLGGPPTSNVVVTDGGANNVSNVVVTSGGANNVSNVVVTSGGANNVSNVEPTRYPTVTSVPPTPKVKLPVISGASPARLLADALAAYRPAGAIEGEETGKERQNVWNEKSLRLKDALGL